MNRLLAGGFGWSLAWLATTALAGAPAQAAGPVVIASSSQPAADAGVSLGRPQLMEMSAKPQAAPAAFPLATPSAIQRVAFAETSAPVVVRAYSAEATNFAAPDMIETGELRHSSSVGGDFAAEPRYVSAGGVSFAPEAGPSLPATSYGSLPPPPPPHPTAVPDAGCGCGVGNVCGAPCCDCSDCCNCCCSDGHRFWFRADYLLWWIRAPQLPVLASTGLLGTPGTAILFGGDDVHYNAFSGGQFTFGYWCDACQQHGFEISGFFLGQQTNGFNANSIQDPTIARPFFNINTGTQDAQITAAPGIATGTLTIRDPASLWGIEANYRCNLCCNCNWRVDGLVGFRFLDFQEGVNINENVTSLISNPPFQAVGDQALVFDNFGTRNQFYGTNLGLDFEGHYGRWVFDIRPEVALGVNDQLVSINGGQFVRRATGATQSFVGGLLALPSNIGDHRRDRFSVVSEIQFNIGYQITDNLTVFVGYSFLDWTNVLRAGQQIDTVLDINQIPNFRGTANPAAPQTRPIVPFKESNFWAQGVNVGLQYKY